MTPERIAYLRELVERGEYCRSAYEHNNPMGALALDNPDSINESKPSQCQPAPTESDTTISK